MAANSVEATYRAKTRKSAELMKRAAGSLPGGLTRNFGYHRPYPVVMDRGNGAFLWDVDGNRYVDLVYNGLSLIHGHAYPPVTEALVRRLPEGWAWLGTSRPQIEFAEVLCNRIKIFERVLFTNSGTESGMLAVKLARRFTGRPLILKANGGYHGTYSDLEAGLHGQGELPGHTLLADFNDLASFEAVLAKRSSEIAAVLLEPVMYTGAIYKLRHGAQERYSCSMTALCSAWRQAGRQKDLGLSPTSPSSGNSSGAARPWEL
jgi:glutamate-1-semialdehyde 2,1-aminomutase